MDIPPCKNKSADDTGDESVFLSRREHLFADEQLRERLPHAAHCEWKPPGKQRDPIELLEESNRYRLPSLVPLPAPWE